jgi:hypothetical protein
MGGGLVVAAVPTVEVADRHRGELLGRELQSRHVNGVEDAAERFEVATCEPRSDD